MTKPTTTLNKYDIAKNLAFFLLDRTGSVFGRWEGRLSAEEQRELFGAYFFGKKVIVIDGSRDMVETCHKVAFGNDYEHVLYSLDRISSPL